MTYPLKFRHHVLSVRQKEKLTLHATAKRFNIGIASLTRWTKSLQPKAHGSRKRKLDLLALKRAIIAHPYRYQYEHAAAFNVSRKAIWNAMKQLNVSYKKNTVSSQSRRRKAYFIS